MTSFLLCLGWFLSGFTASCLMLNYQNRSLERRFGDKVRFTVGDLIMACFLGLGGLITVATVCIVGTAVFVCKVIDAIVGFDTPLFKNNRHEKG